MYVFVFSSIYSLAHFSMHSQISTFMLECRDIYIYSSFFRTNDETQQKQKQESLYSFQSVCVGCGWSIFSTVGRQALTLKRE